MLKELFKKQQQYINAFFDKLDHKKAHEIFDAFLACKGTIFFAGVGKSGFIANKIATTMTSTGTKALCLSPTDALHGDIGIVKEEDVFVLISKSGETEELLNLVPYIRNKGAYVIAFVSRENSRLEKACDKSIYLPLEKELCPFDLVPATSAAIQLIFGDVLAVALMHAKNFSLDEYARNHPLGRIGKRITMRVRDLMLHGDKIPICSPEDKLFDVLVELSNKQCGCVVVTKEEKICGIFTDGDLRRSLQEKGGDVLNVPMKDLMMENPRSIEAGKLAAEAMHVMEDDQKHPIMVLPVTEGDKLVGVIKMHDIVQSGL
ncbi:MAG: KpsF/GutQ family sugar-phosphate isomerase [Waddliaceae bacterium]|jgi:arabinose-5-phosphate isomerase|nr:KpsF/GutQ family sugar-phosphate isomerase [Waddliaceae bacterium]MBT3578537.1 KpsF/GutQ family sugar-phosphate isomerase [Waddliaceae bacterium]MBT4444682.1 KpsF/GutQ family sugar-phosphate isomerase [Waddliaceae bacterium]MBT6928719.1 KpsF/GutQ family sugar-phosphate isomerase [Waddliaceae bacterium]MBT7264951.1 KpsF/GutQ family sugar-phosphate isomerase [Waddliaceae bacterium]